MAFCDIGSDNTAFVCATYLVALLPWSVITWWDPINRNWEPYWKTWLASWLYLLVSILPYFLLVPYAALQGCSADPDIKELLTAVITMFASFWNIRRALRGLLALREIQIIWERLNICELALYFEDWIVPESKRGTIANVPKLDVADILVSHHLIDNDWPGEAPQTPYLWPRFVMFLLRPSGWTFFPFVRAIESDWFQKKCMLTLWTLWMSHGRDKRFQSYEWLEPSKNTLYVEKSRSYLRYVVQWLLGTCYNVSYSDKPQPWLCDVCRDVPEELKKTNVCSWCRLRPLVTRALIVQDTDEHESRLAELELLNQISNLPPKVQGALRPTDPGRIRSLYGIHFELDFLIRHGPFEMRTRSRVWKPRSIREDALSYLCPAFRVGHALGLSTKHDNTIRTWLLSTANNDSHDGGITSNSICKKFLAFAVLLALQGNPRDMFRSLFAALREEEMVPYTLSSWSAERHLHQLGRIVRSCQMLLHSDAEAKPLDVLHEGNQQAWNTLISSFMGSDWTESSNARTLNDAVILELELLSRMLTYSEIPGRSPDRFEFFPSCVDFHFEVIGNSSNSFADRIYKSVPAAQTVKPNTNSWDISDDRRRILLHSHYSLESVSLHAKFESIGTHQVWKVGLRFRFPSWTYGKWPEYPNEGLVFVISVYDENDSLTFKTEEFNTFHFTYFSKAKPWTGERNMKFPLEIRRLLKEDNTDDSLQIAPRGAEDHSSWRIFECSNIPTGGSQNKICLSLECIPNRYGWTKKHELVEIDSFYIAPQTAYNEMNPSNTRGQHSCHTISAMKKVVSEV